MSLLKFFKRSNAATEQEPSVKRLRNESEESQTDHGAEDAQDSDKLSADTDSDCPESSSSSAPSKQSRRFRKVWSVGREQWLLFSRQDCGMFCTLCQKYNKRPYSNDVWSKVPCTRLRLQSILAHERSVAHKDAVQLAAAAATTENVVAALNRPVSAVGMEQAFYSLYFLAKRRIPHTTHYEPLHDFIGLLGIDIKSKISIAKNATYTSEKTIQEMIYIISEVIENNILNEMRNSNHFSIMLDETTDCSVIEQLAVHGRYISPTGELKCHYLKTIDLLHSESGEADVSVCAGAETVTKRVCGYIEQACLDMGKLRGIGTDGAPTMVGSRTGVVTRLQAIQPSAVGVHCAAHRLNLASSQAGDKVPYIKHFKSILRQLFDFFDNSAVRMAGLDAIKQLLGEKGKLQAPSSTRWLSVEACLSKLKLCFASVVLSLEREGEERSDAKAIGLHGLITQYRFVCTMLLMCDTLPHLARMAKCFQIAECDYSVIPKILASTVTSMEQLKTCNGMNLSSLQKYLDGLQEKSIEIKKPANLAEEYFKDSVRIPFLTCLIDNIHKRFPDKTLLSSFDIFNPRKLPNEDQLDEYGFQEIIALSERFKDSVASSEVCLEEWGGYRQLLRVSPNLTKHSEVINDLCTNETTATLFPNMAQLARICRVIPIHTADVERTFSQLKLIKSRTRNRMNEKTLDSLLRIAIEGPDIDKFPITQAVQLWASKKNRRLFS